MSWLKTKAFFHLLPHVRRRLEPIFATSSVDLSCLASLQQSLDVHKIGCTEKREILSKPLPLLCSVQGGWGVVLIGPEPPCSRSLRAAAGATERGYARGNFLPRLQKTFVSIPRTARAATLLTTSRPIPSAHTVATHDALQATHTIATHTRLVTHSAVISILCTLHTGKKTHA